MSPNGSASAATLQVRPGHEGACSVRLITQDRETAMAQQVAQEPVEAARGFGFEIRDPQRFAQNMARLVEETGKAVTAFVEPRVSNPAQALAGGGDFTHIMNALNQIQQAWFFQPQWRRRSCGSAI